MQQFIIILNRTLIIGYAICILPLVLGLVTGRSIPVVTQNPLAHFIQSERQSVLEKSKSTTLNLYMPKSFYPLYLSDPKISYNSGHLWDYVRYFQQVVEALPASYAADANAMLGFCYFHQKKFKESYDSYSRSLEQNPAFLWTYYNLALIEFKAGNYDKTVFLLDLMFKLNPEISIKVISSSKIYADVLRGHRGVFDFSIELKETCGDAMRMSVISLYQLKKYSEVLSAVQYAISSGFEPKEVFYYYAGLAANALGDAPHAEAFRQLAGQGAGELYTGQDISVRFF